MNKQRLEAVVSFLSFVLMLLLLIPLLSLFFGQSEDKMMSMMGIDLSDKSTKDDKSSMGL
jgi:ABC-type sulfate transport system permease component